MGRRILDMICGAGLAVAGLIVGAAIFCRVKQKQNGTKDHHKCTAASHHPTSLPVAVNNPAGSEENQQPTTDQQDAGQRAGQQQPQFDRPLSTRAEIAIAIIAAIGFIGSAIGLYIVYKTSIATGESAEATLAYSKTTEGQLTLSREIATRQLRAYVVVEHVRVSGLDSDGPLHITISTKNTGQTPAYKVHQLTGAFYENSEFAGPFIPNPAIPDEGLSTIGGGVPNEIFGDRDTSAEDKSLIKSGTKALWVSGRITYTDAFGADHFTAFRAMTGGKIGVHDNKMIPTKDGNDAD